MCCGVGVPVVAAVTTDNSNTTATTTTTTTATTTSTTTSTSRYAGVASHARNFHNWAWDAPRPTELQDFFVMGCGAGTRSFWWNDWHAEYRGWRSADAASTPGRGRGRHSHRSRFGDTSAEDASDDSGSGDADDYVVTTMSMSVQASVQFDNSFAGDVGETWGGSLVAAFHAAYNYGFGFAWHLGPTHGSGDVDVLEVGNEPFEYSLELCVTADRRAVAYACAGLACPDLMGPFDFQSYFPNNKVPRDPPRHGDGGESG
jgi:hypothetical protein